MDIGTKVIDIIAEQAILDPGDVTLESTLDSLGVDSMGLVESIFEIEEAFDIKFLLTQMIHLTVSSIYHLYHQSYLVLKN